MLQNHFDGTYSLPVAVSSVFGPFFNHQLFVGPVGSGAPFHFHGPALNAVLYGRKQWSLQPPGRKRYSKRPPSSSSSHERQSDDGDGGGGGGGGGVDLAALGAISCVQHPGEMLFLPRLWAHSTMNLDEVVGIALEFEGLE